MALSLSRFGWLTVASLALSTVLGSAAGAQAQAVTFELTNGTGATINEFYASPPNVDDWEQDILGEDVMPPGQTFTITINDGRPNCDYDFKVVYADGSEVEYDAISVCNGESWVVK